LAGHGKDNERGYAPDNVCGIMELSAENETGEDEHVLEPLVRAKETEVGGR
jgi:hypothetical protein